MGYKNLFSAFWVPLLVLLLGLDGEVWAQTAKNDRKKVSKATSKKSSGRSAKAKRQTRAKKKKRAKSKGQAKRSKAAAKRRASTRASGRSATMDRALRLYKSGDYYSASIEFYKVVNKEVRDTEASQQRAVFSLGKTLYQMGYYAASLAYFDRIVGEGRKHRYYGPTLKWLVSLARVLPETSGILDKVGEYGTEDADDASNRSVRNELYYLLGRYAYRKNQLDRAIDLFQKVEEIDPFYLRAKLFEGVTHVRKRDPKPAVLAFKQILRVAADRPKQFPRGELDRFEELAQLQMARVFYSTRQYDTSIKYFEKLTPKSPDWLDSLFEASWAYFMKTNFSKALGNIHTLNAPYFEEQFFPESPLLSAVIFYKYCLYDRALEMVAAYNGKFKPLRQNLKAVVAKHEDDSEFYKYVLQIVDGKAGLEKDTQLLVSSVLTDKTLKKTFNWVAELAKELKMLEKADKSWQGTAIAGEVLQELTLQESLAVADAGKLARDRIERLMKELQEHTRNGLKIKLQALEEKAGHFTKKARGEKISGDHREDPIIVDDEHFMWKFDGEYWKDELGFYRFKIRSRCPKTKTN